LNESLIHALSVFLVLTLIRGFSFPFKIVVPCFCTALDFSSSLCFLFFSQSLPPRPSFERTLTPLPVDFFLDTCLPVRAGALYFFTTPFFPAFRYLRAGPQWHWFLPLLVYRVDCVVVSRLSLIDFLVFFLTSSFPLTTKMRLTSCGSGPYGPTVSLALSLPFLSLSEPLGFPRDPPFSCITASQCCMFIAILLFQFSSSVSPFLSTFLQSLEKVPPSLDGGFFSNDLPFLSVCCTRESASQFPFTFSFLTVARHPSTLPSV